MRVALVLLLAAVCHNAVAYPFRVYGPCPQALGTTQPEALCRFEPTTRQAGSAAAVAAAAPPVLPVDMVLPCTDGRRCSKNVDVAFQPEAPEDQDGTLLTQNVTLMQWSPFPCSYDTTQYTGISGQRTSYCYSSTPDHSSNNSSSGSTSSRKASGTDNNSSSIISESADADNSADIPPLASNLTTDGYINLFYGVLPSDLCGDGQGYECQFDRLLLTVEFRVAKGRQFDRTYSFQLGHAVAAFGTCTEPSRIHDSDKTWSSTVDITHLTNYLELGVPTRFSLGNMLSNTYNVPLWAKVTLTAYVKQTPPTLQRSLKGSLSSKHFAATTPRQVQRTQHEQQQYHSQQKGECDPQHIQQWQPSAYSADKVAAILATAVPDEVYPLSPPQQLGLESLTVLAGNGECLDHDPSVTFNLPADLSAGCSIYRAQLLVVPKADACEEFWAMTPSGAKTGSTCGDASTGEPFRELRVYVDGQLAGFYPIYYTMYTGGVDPRLWSAIVPHRTYQLPAYRFDLSPWLGVLNTIPSRDIEGQPLHTITAEVAGATNHGWILANTLLIWRLRDPKLHIVATIPVDVSMSASLLAPVSSDCWGSANLTEAGECSITLKDRMLSAGAVLSIDSESYLASVKYNTMEYANNIVYNNSDSTLAWQQVTKHEAAWSLAKWGPTAQQHGQQQQMHLTGDVQQQQWWSQEGLGTANGQILASSPQQRSASPSSSSTTTGHQQQGHGSSAVSSDMHGGSSSSNEGSASSSNSGDVFIWQGNRYDWLNSGAVTAAGIFEMSYNVTQLDPQATTNHGKVSYEGPAEMMPGEAAGWQQHYQRAIMVDVYNTSKPSCPASGKPTHTVQLKGAAQGKQQHLYNFRAASDSVCTVWHASCVFCGVNLTVDDLSKESIDC